MVDEKPKEVKDSSIDNDEIFISLTKERIDQEISNLSADETKASIIIGVVAAVFGITFTVKEYLEFLLVNGCAWTSIGLLLIAFFCSVIVVLPRNRLNLIKPRETINDYAELEKSKLLKTLKKELVENFEYIEKSRKRDPNLILIGFSSLIAGTVGIFITLLYIFSLNE